MDSIQEKILKHIAKTNQCGKWPKKLKPYMVTQCGQCPLKDRCWPEDEVKTAANIKREVKDLANEMLEEESRAKIKEVLGLDQTDEIKAKQIAILKILASKPMSCGNTDEFNKVEILKGPKQSICRCCLIRKECNSLIGSKGSNDSVLKERQAIALEKYNRIMLRKQLGLLDPNDSQKSGACDMEESYDESGNKEEGGKSS